MRNILVSGAKGQLGTDCLDVFKDTPGLAGVDLPEVDLSDSGKRPFKGIGDQCFRGLER